MSKRNVHVVDQEVTFSKEEELISITDKRGVIQYINDEFCRVSGFSREELIGKNHNIVRHPDMPKEAFKDMWEKLQNSKNWRGAVKNRCKDGKYYWVDAFVMPYYENNELIGYQSVRTTLSTPIKNNAEMVYNKLQSGKYTHFNLSLPVRHLIFGIFAITNTFLSLYFNQPLLSFINILLPFVIYNKEIFGNIKIIKNLKNDYDSISRVVYSGNNDSSIIDFHKKIEEGKIKTIIGRLKESTSNLNNGVVELNKSSEKTTESLNNEVLELSTISSSVTQMLQISDITVNNTEQTKLAIEDVNASCISAGGDINSTQKNIKHLEKEMLDTVSTVEELSSKVSNIIQVMYEINGIAEQTNLLALNAAIEAARAGEAGKGFAVVADEVRNLSNRTKNSTVGIEGLVSEIQSVLSNLSNRMEEETKITHKCVDSTESLQTVISNIVNKMNSSKQLTIDINNANIKQADAVRNIDEAMIKIKELSDANMNRVKDIQLQSKNIMDNSEKLISMSKTFDN